MVSSKILEFVSVKFDHPAVTASLIGAGAVPSVVPTWFSNNPVQTVYYLFLLPPAAWSCFIFLKNQVWPLVKRWFK